jgi:signal transduction histidine kinase
MWIGDETGITEFDGRNFISYPLQQGVIDKRVLCIRRDINDILWFGTSTDGLYKYDRKSFIHYPEKAGLSSKKIFALLVDKKGNLWLGTERGGVSKYDGTHITNYSEKEGFLGETVTSIIEDKKGALWLGTQGSGVCRFDGNNFTYYTEKEGLSNDNVWSLIQDSAGYIWAGTDKGLNRFIPINNSYIIHQYGLQDGLKAIDFNLHSASIDNNNQLWWGTGKNIVIKDLNTPFKSYGVRSLQLTRIEINDRFYDYHNVPDSLGNKIAFSHLIPFTNCPGSLTLSYDQNHLSFHFSAIDWSAPDKIKYSYRMVGLDEKWSKPSGETMADYRGLRHGNYQFQVKAIGQSQAWTEPFTYSFVIRPAWWQTWWFKSTILLLAALLLLYISRLIYRSRLRKQKALMEKQLAVQMERQRISKEMHDDIGAGLSGVRLLTEMTKNKLKETSATSEIDKIHQSVGEISAKMKEVIWSLNTENDSLGNLIAYIQRQVKAQLENYPAELIMELPVYIPDFEFSGDTRRNIYLSVKEAVHNIIKHSGADRVILSISCNENLVISVADNGRGAGAAVDDHTGNGMKNMRQRIEQSGGQFFIKKEKGLTLTFSIPLKPHL